MPIEPAADGSITPMEARALCKAAVELWKETTGRGAEHAVAYGTRESVTLVFRGILTKLEQGIPDDVVKQGRRALFDNARERLEATVESAAGTPIETVLYDVDPGHDSCAFTFIFARQLRGGSEAPSAGTLDEVRPT